MWNVETRRWFLLDGDLTGADCPCPRHSPSLGRSFDPATARIGAADGIVIVQSRRGTLLLEPSRHRWNFRRR